MAQVNHECIICGTGYKACDDCDKLGNWRAICDTPEHYQIYMVLMDVNANRMSKEHALAYFESNGIDELQIADFKPSVKDLIQNILDLKKVESIEVPFVESESYNEIEEDIQTVQPYTAGRKKKR